MGVKVKIKIRLTHRSERAPLPWHLADTNPAPQATPHQTQSTHPFTILQLEGVKLQICLSYLWVFSFSCQICFQIKTIGSRTPLSCIFWGLVTGGKSTKTGFTELYSTAFVSHYHFISIQHLQAGLQVKIYENEVRSARKPSIYSLNHGLPNSRSQRFRFPFLLRRASQNLRNASSLLRTRHLRHNSASPFHNRWSVRLTS